MEVMQQEQLLSPQERRRRNRQEVIDAILAAAREIMRRDGVAALNLNEVARMFREQDAEIWHTTEPG